jgi:hypothetical protein
MLRDDGDEVDAVAAEAHHVEAFGPGGWHGERDPHSAES